MQRLRWAGRLSSSSLHPLTCPALAVERFVVVEAASSVNAVRRQPSPLHLAGRRRQHRRHLPALPASVQGCPSPPPHTAQPRRGLTMRLAAPALGTCTTPPRAAQLQSRSMGWAAATPLRLPSSSSSLVGARRRQAARGGSFRRRAALAPACALPEEAFHKVVDALKEVPTRPTDREVVAAGEAAASAAASTMQRAAEASKTVVRGGGSWLRGKQRRQKLQPVQPVLAGPYLHATTTDSCNPTAPCRAGTCCARRPPAPGCRCWAARWQQPRGPTCSSAAWSGRHWAGHSASSSQSGRWAEQEGRAVATRHVRRESVFEHCTGTQPPLCSLHAQPKVRTTPIPQPAGAGPPAAPLHVTAHSPAGQRPCCQEAAGPGGRAPQVRTAFGGRALKVWAVACACLHAFKRKAADQTR